METCQTGFKWQMTLKNRITANDRITRKHRMTSPHTVLPWNRSLNSTRGVPNMANRAVADRVVDPMKEVEQGASTSWVIELSLKGDLDPVRSHH